MINVRINQSILEFRPIESAIYVAMVRNKQQDDPNYRAAVYYPKGSNKISIDGEDYKISPETKMYLQDIRHQIRTRAIPKIKIETKELVILTPEEHTGDKENNGLIKMKDEVIKPPKIVKAKDQAETLLCQAFENQDLETICSIATGLIERIPEEQLDDYIETYEEISGE